MRKKKREEEEQWEHPITRQMIKELGLDSTPERMKKMEKIVIGVGAAAIVMGVVFLPLGGMLGMVTFVGLLSLWQANMNLSLRRKNLMAGLKVREARCELEELWEDYQTAEELLGMKLGRRYIVSLTTGTVVSYNEIRNVHQYVHKTYFIEDSRALQAVTTGNKTVTLTGLARKGKADEDLKRVIAFLLTRNPSITVGYGR